MKALAKTKREAGLEMIEVEKPTIGPMDVLIKIKKTAVCGTDLHIYNWDEWSQNTIPVPMHVGHEYVGEIEEVGDMVEGFEVGDRVSGEGHITCGHCRNCRGGREHLCRNTIGVGVNRPGAFAEYLAIPARNAFKVPNDIPDDIVSVFDPLGNAVHTALSFDMAGEDVLINGAGPIGLMCVAICRFVGARHIVITDLNDHRLQLAKDMGASETLNVSSMDDHSKVVNGLKGCMKTLGMTEGFDIGLEVSGHFRAIASMIDTMNNGGRIGLLGVSSQNEICVPWNNIIWRGLFLKGIYGREMFETWYKMVSLIQSGLDISPVITHHFKAEEFEKGFALMNEGKCGKVILDWS